MIKKENEAELRVLQATLADVQKRIRNKKEEIRQLRDAEKDLMDSIDKLEQE